MTTAEPGGALLTLSQWLSPAFPLGAFSWSHGLETAIARNEVRDAATLEAWLGAVLTLGAGRTDATLLAHALAGADPAMLTDIARALAPSAERAAETEGQGAALARTVSALTGRDIPPAPLPVALGVAARPLGLPAETVVALYLQGFAGALVSAAIRAVPLGQTAGQGVLARLHPAILAEAQAAPGRSLAQVGTAVFGADLAAMEHETQEVRLFQS
jgi:urease accessory protein